MEIASWLQGILAPRRNVGAYRGPVPGHVREILQIAAREGLKARLDVPIDDRHEETILVRISGSEAALRRTGIIRSKFQFPVRYRQEQYGSFHFDMVRETSGTYELALTYLAPKTVSAAKGDGVEKMQFYAQRRGLWGAPSEVAKLVGLPVDNLHSRWTRGRRGRNGSRSWWASRFPSGNVLFMDWENAPRGADLPARPPEYDTPASFAKLAERIFEALAFGITYTMSGAHERQEYGECTISYDADTIAQVKDAFAEARLAIQAATPSRTKKARAVLAAREDTEFRTFLSQIVAPSDRACGKSQ